MSRTPPLEIENLTIEPAIDGGALVSVDDHHATFLERTEMIELRDYLTNLIGPQSARQSKE